MVAVTIPTRSMMPTHIRRTLPVFAYTREQWLPLICWMCVCRMRLLVRLESMEVSSRIRPSTQGGGLHKEALTVLGSGVNPGREPLSDSKRLQTPFLLPLTVLPHFSACSDTHSPWVWSGGCLDLELPSLGRLGSLCLVVAGFCHGVGF